MKLFFPVEGKQEFACEEENNWKAVPFGYYAMRFLNAFMQNDFPRVMEMAGLPEGTEEEVLKAPFPVLPLVYAVAKTDLFKEQGLFTGKFKGVKKITASFLREFFTFRKEFDNLPFLVPFLREGMLGWYVSCDTVKQAAVAELTLAFMRKVKPFKICSSHKLAYREKTCPRCRPGKEKKRHFQGLLRRHKGELQKRERVLRGKLNKLKEEKARSELQQAIEEIQYGIGEIEKLQEKLRGKPLTKEIVKEYAEICKEAGLPTRWVKKYL